MAETNLQDDLNRKIGVLTRREAEARILAPLMNALADEFGRERVEKVVSETIVSLAREQGQPFLRNSGIPWTLSLRRFSSG